MTSDREFAETLLLGRWDGYSEEQLTIELLLKRSMGIVDGEGSEVGYRAKRKWWCTCVCAGGWLSARMRFHLESEYIFSFPRCQC